jgi:[ribosomal protein S18]-alanine N-acetyltransferase
MSQHEALVVAAWQYEPPYSFYDWTADADDLAELLGKETREGKYFSAVGADEELVGWFAFSDEGDCIGVGLGFGQTSLGGGSGWRTSKLGSRLPYSGSRQVGFVCQSRPSTSVPSASTSGLVSHR